MKSQLLSRKGEEVLSKEIAIEKRKESFSKLEALVNARGISFYKIANDLGFTTSLFSDWKVGKSMPKTDKLIKLAEYFGVPVDYFVVE